MHGLLGWQRRLARARRTATATLMGSRRTPRAGAGCSIVAMPAGAGIEATAAAKAAAEAEAKVEAKAVAAEVVVAEAVAAKAAAAKVVVAKAVVAKGEARAVEEYPRRKVARRDDRKAY